MVMFYCPRCQVREAVANHSGDFVHECRSGIPAIDQEDILIKGTWTDYTGSDFTVRTSPANIMWQNLGNKVGGMQSHIRDGAILKPVSPRGANTLIYRQRQHLEYIENPENVPKK